MWSKNGWPYLGAANGLVPAPWCVYQQSNKVFFVYGFAKNERANISIKQLKALKLLATQLLGYTNHALVKATNAGELIEVNDDD